MRSVATVKPTLLSALLAASFIYGIGTTTSGGASAHGGTIPSTRYEFIQGGLNDVPNLPTMRGLAASLYNEAINIVPDDVLPNDAAKDYEPTLSAVSEGQRNVAMYRHCMRHAHHYHDRNDLLDLARTFNVNCVPPLSDDEVMKTVNSAWRYTERGENRFGTTGSWLPTDTVRQLAPDPHLLSLLTFLKAENRPDRMFMIADGLANVLHWPRRKLTAARRKAVEGGFVVMVSKPHRGHPGLYRFGPALRVGREKQSEGVV
jgi:Primase C terminal 1 (PriCT-1)